MLTKFRTTKFMKVRATSEEAVIEFNDHLKHIAKVHHCGLKEKSPSNVKEIQYELRPLLGVENYAKFILGIIFQILK